MITRFDSLDISPEEGSLFLSHHFYSSLKETILAKKDYDAVKKFYQTMKLKNLGELNKLYNFQDTIILCETLENRSLQLQKLFKYNPRKCNSASSFSGCVHRCKSKCLIALPTEADHVRVFEKTLIGGFSCVNTRLAFDSQILLPKDNIDNHKLIFDLKTNNLNEKKMITTKILKTDENNQYGQTMTKPLPYGCIKKMKKPNLLEFNRILDRLSHEDNIGHLFIVDINFITKPLKQCCFTRCTFEQAKFKKDFVIMNQKARQNATSLVERDFYKL